MEIEITNMAERIAGEAVPSPGTAGGSRAPGAGDEVLFREVLNGNGEPPVFALGEPRGGTVKAGAAGLSGGLGEAVLQGIENVSRSQAGQIERINGMVAGAGEEPLSPADLMRLQYEVMMLAFEQELAARVVDKVDQGIRPFLKLKADGIVKSPYAAFPFTPRPCGVPEVRLGPRVSGALPMELFPSPFEEALF